MRQIIITLYTAFLIGVKAVLESNLDIKYEVLFMTFLCGIVGAVARVSVDNEESKIKRSRVLSIFSATFMTSILAYLLISEYFEKTNVTYGISVVLGLISVEIVMGVKLTIKKVFSGLGDILLGALRAKLNAPEPPKNELNNEL